MNSEIQSFFAQFEQYSAASDFDGSASQYADTFLFADPAASRAVQVADLRAALPKRKQMFQSIGCKSTKLVSLEDTPLDDRHFLVRTMWRWEFANTEVILPSTFILRRHAGTFQIIFYLSHQDLMQVMRERGITPST